MSTRGWGDGSREGVDDRCFAWGSYIFVSLALAHLAHVRSIVP
jgi:hypothetical protein